MNLPFTAFLPHSGSSAAYQYVGLKSISTAGFTYSGNGFGGSGSSGTFPCIGSYCSQNCVSVATCSVNYGKIIAGKCFLCGSDQIFKDNNCQRKEPCG